MQVYSATSILSFNTGHFKRFPGLTVLNPTQVRTHMDGKYCWQIACEFTKPEGLRKFALATSAAPGRPAQALQAGLLS